MRCFRIFRKNYFLVLIGLLLSSGNIRAQQSGELLYADLPRLIKENNGSVQSARLLAKASEKRTGHLMRSYLPHVKTFVGYENYKTATSDLDSQPYGGVEVRMNIFNFGKDTLDEDIRKAEHKKNQTSEILNYNEKLFGARKIFWRIAYHNELVEVLKKAELQNKKILASANRRINRGLTTKTDRLEFNMYAKDLESNIESLEHESKILKIALSTYLGKDVRFRSIKIKSIPHEHDDALINENFDKQSNANVRFAEATSALLKAKASKSKKWWTPAIDVYGGYSLYTSREREFTNLSDRDDTYAGVRLTMNIFDGFKSSSESASQSAKSAAADTKLKYITEKFKGQFEVIKEEMKHAHELTHFSEEKIKQGEVYFKRTLEEYDKGIKNSLDVLSSLQRIVSFKTEYATIRLDYQNKKTALLKIKGI